MKGNEMDEMMRKDNSVDFSKLNKTIESIVENSADDIDDVALLGKVLDNIDDSGLDDDYMGKVLRLTKNAANGDTESQIALWYLYESMGDDESARLWHKALVDKNDADIFYLMGCLYCNEECPFEDLDDSIEWKPLLDYAEGTKWFRRAAEMGHAESQYVYASMCIEGIGVEKNPTEGIKWLRKAAEQGDVDAQSMLGKVYDEGVEVERNCSEALNWYLKASKQGDVESIYAIAEKLYFGEMGVKKDCRKAFGWYHSAAEKGYVPAMQDVARIYKFGEDDVPVNFIKAEKWYRSLVDNGNIEAVCDLGQLYCWGSYTSQENVEADFESDEFKALCLFLIAIRLGVAAAMREVAYMYESGKICNKTIVSKIETELNKYEKSNWDSTDKIYKFVEYLRNVYGEIKVEPISSDDKRREKIKWLERAVSAGHAGSAYELGNFYYCEPYDDFNRFSGNIQLKIDNYLKAYDYFVKAMELGEDEYLIDNNIKETCHELGHTFERSNPSKAVEWYLKAANKGYLQSQKRLAEMYRYGLGVPRNLAEAEKWENMHK